MLDAILSIFRRKQDEQKASRESVCASAAVNDNDNDNVSADAKAEAEEEPKNWSIYPCPFCGGNVLTFIRQSIATGGRHDGQHWVVLCEKCGAKSSLCPTKGEAVEMWNKPANEFNRLVRNVNELEEEVENLKKASPEGILQELGRQDGLFKTVNWTSTTETLPKAKRKRPSCIGAGRKRKSK